MKLTALALPLLLAIPGAAFAQEGKDLAELSFESVDTAGRGYIDMGEFTNFGSDVFLSMDYDEDDKIVLDEFMNWGFGMGSIAEEEDRKAAFDTALRVVFAFWDRNGDGEMSRSEHRRSLVADFQRADLNNDLTLDKGEFLGGFSINVAMRAAIAPKE